MIKDYTKLAGYYDQLQADIDYSVWQDWLINEIVNNDVKVLEIGCGTGKIANFLSLNDVEIDAFDLSPEMIKVAKGRNEKVNFYVDDMTSFSRDKKYDYVICFMDTFNYLTNDQQLDNAFKRINMVLNDGGKLLFDIHLEDNLELFDDYKEQINLGTVKLLWNSKITDRTKCLVDHEFLFKEKNNITKEIHHQRICSIDNFKTIYKQYFIEDNIETDEYRNYITLRKDTNA